MRKLGSGPAFSHEADFLASFFGRFVFEVMNSFWRPSDLKRGGVITALPGFREALI
jgi:hypothetical protein